MGGIGTRTAAAGTLAVVTAFLAAACGGGGSPSSASEPQNADFTISQQTDTGLRDAYATFTSRSDGKTSAIIDLTVERTAAASGVLYAVTEREGSCDSMGVVSIDVGEASDGITNLLLDKSFDDVVKPLRDGSANMVIAKKGSNIADWCGASENPS